MTVVILLALFEPFFQGSHLDASSPGLKDVVTNLATEKAVYAAIGEEAFVDYLDHGGDPTYLNLDKTVEVLRFLLYLDGRSELGLLRITELAYARPEHAAEATNALAALAGYYRSGGRSFIDPAELSARFEKYMTNPDLFHNARECRNALREPAHR